MSRFHALNYFIIRTEFDVKAADDFKAFNKPAENHIYCGHVQTLLASSKGISILKLIVAAKK